MRNQELNYHNDLRIHRDSLDEEWLDQPRRYMDYAELLADARKDLAKVHERLKICTADLVAEGRKKLDSPTVQEVEAYYRRDKRHKKAKVDFIDAEHKVNILGSAVSAFAQRKNALENLVQLWKGGYYSKPKEEHDSNEPMRRAGSRVSRMGREKVEERMIRRRKQ